jgi:hypothetical protein
MTHIIPEIIFSNSEHHGTGTSLRSFTSSMIASSICVAAISKAKRMEGKRNIEKEVRTVADIL